ncbi:MAG: hypothetical protein NTY38_02185 [Acidobacteria bacterium]|nr:hypothetical protein [Acidobacteriota bacterium]
MRLKSYFANTVESAMSLARQELGPDALLMKSGPAIPEALYLGKYEVVFAAPEPAMEPAARWKAPRAEAPPVAAPSPALDQLTQDVAELRKQLELTTSAMAKANRQQSTLGAAEVAAGETPGRLELADLSPAAISRIAGRTAGKQNGDARALEEAIAAELPTSRELGKIRAIRRIVALVGPVKLAVTYGLKGRRPPQILSADLYRIAAAEQLRSYAAILGVGFQTAETGLLLSQQLEEHRNKGLVLIDTPGFGAREMDAAQDLAALLARHPEIDTHLVLTATTKTADLLAAADRYRIFRPSKLIFTRCDETEAFGQIVDLCFHTGLPVSFLGTGQQIPEGLEAADSDRLARMVLGDTSEAGLEQSTGVAA